MTFFSPPFALSYDNIIHHKSLSVNNFFEKILELFLKCC
nr:MAG TPA: hypothetical protein [Caudoviricetes sp.]